MRLRPLFAEEAAFRVLALLADVERRDGPVIAHHASPYLAGLALVVRQREQFGNGFGLDRCIHAFLLSIRCRSRGKLLAFLREPFRVARGTELVLAREVA